MNVRLLLTLCLFSSLSLHAQQVKTLSDLKKGDWFTLEYVKYHPFPEDNPSLRNADIYEYLVTVSDRTNSDLQFAINPKRVRFHETVYSGREYHLKGKASNASSVSITDNSGNSGSANTIRINFSQESPSKPIHFYYFDSYYCDDFVLVSPNYTGSQDVVTFKMNLQQGFLSDTAYYLDNKGWHYTKEMIFEGIKKKNTGVFIAYSKINEDGKPFYEKFIRNAFANCNPRTTFPGLAEEREVNDTIYRIQVTDASFPLIPNLKLSFYSERKLTSDELILEVNYRKYALKQEDNGFVRFDFFLPHLSMGKMINTVVSMTPGDSIAMLSDANGDITFSGKGAENCRFWHELSKHQSFLDKYLNDRGYTTSSTEIPLPSHMESYLATGDSIFQALQSQYASQMSPYWLESSQLSYKYWYMAQVLQSHLKHHSIIEWEKEPFNSVTPFLDYLFHPQHYTSFINLYSDYIQEDLHRDVLIRTVNYHINLMSKYYSQKGLLAGYPKYLALSETLLKLIETEALSKFQNEYQDFTTECKDPVLLQKVVQEYDLSLKIQPGENIRKLQLSIEQELPLKKTADGYILIIMGYPENSGAEYKELLADMTDSLDAIGLKTNIRVIRPERYEAITRLDTTTVRILTTSPNPDKPNETIIQLDTTHRRTVVHRDESEDLSKDCQILRTKKNSLLLLRNDGVIIAKDITNYWTRTLDGKKVFNTEKIKPLIKDDMERNKKAGFDFMILFILFAAMLVTGGTAYFIYQARVKVIRKKEENKRLISELELKAIRSQMNPHFIFNALSSIQYLINQGKNSQANQYLLNFANLLRMVLATSEKKLVSLSEEAAQLELYLQLEQLRVPFDYRITIDSTIQPDNEEIPGMLIQPVVENAVKHGVSHIRDGTVTIHFRKEAQNILVEITDNGAGFPPQAQQVNGFGLKATEERLRLINEEYKTNIGIRLEHNNPSGAKVTISIPV